MLKEACDILAESASTRQQQQQSQQQGQTQSGQLVVNSESISNNAIGLSDVAIAVPAHNFSSASIDNESHQSGGSGPSAKRRLLERIWNRQELETDWRDTITNYLNCRPKAGEIDDVLLFWRNHADEFEVLQPAARYYLSLSASSVPVEAMFSITGLILNSKRAALSPAKLNCISFIHDNYQTQKAS